MAPPTPKDIGDAISPPKDFDLDKMVEKWEAEDKKMRSIYLDHPDRKQFFEYDLVEALWMQMIEQYGKVVGDEEIEDMVIAVTEDHRLWEMIYDAAEQVAKSNGWEMI